MRQKKFSASVPSWFLLNVFGVLTKIRTFVLKSLKVTEDNFFAFLDGSDVILF